MLRRSMSLAGLGRSVIESRLHSLSICQFPGCLRPKSGADFVFGIHWLWPFSLHGVPSPQQAIVPLQEVLGLGRACRTRCPVLLKRNWEWPLFPTPLTEKIGSQLRGMRRVCLIDGTCSMNQVARDKKKGI
jgi:hypothetical protein